MSDRHMRQAEPGEYFFSLSHLHIANWATRRSKPLNANDYSVSREEVIRLHLEEEDLRIWVGLGADDIIAADQFFKNWLSIEIQNRFPPKNKLKLRQR